MKSTSISLLITIVIGAIITIIAIKYQEKSYQNVNPGANSIIPIKNVPESNWQYSSDVNKMTGTKNHYASVDAKDELEFKFPYSGGVVATLLLRDKNKNVDAILEITKGQFMPSYSGEESVNIRFDNNPPRKYSYSSASDGSTETIFIYDKNRFISNLKKAKRVLIEAEFFNEGNRVMEFDVAGLKWDY